MFYIAASNEYNINVFQKDSQPHQDFLKNIPQVPPLGTSGSKYDLVQNEEWARMYDTDVVAHGDVYLVVDFYRSELENKTLNGWPIDWPNIPTEKFNSWSQGNVTYDLKETLQKQFGNSSDIQGLMNTFAVSKEWLRFDTMVNFARPNTSLTGYPRFAHVAHAYTTRLDTLSRIQLSLVFLIIVIACNTIKLITMIWVVAVERKEYVVTLGDGAASFLERPDPTTERMCILSRKDIGYKISEINLHKKHNDQLSKLVTQNDGTWVRQFTTYSNALNKDRQVGSYFMYAIHVPSD